MKKNSITLLIINILKFSIRQKIKKKNESRGIEIIMHQSYVGEKWQEKKEKNNQSVNLTYHSYNNLKNEVSDWRCNHPTLKILLASLPINA